MRPVVCFDERPCQLLSDVIAPMPMKPGRSKRQNDEYHRNGTCCVLMAFEPLRGWRFVQVRERSTAIDYAAFMEALGDPDYPGVHHSRLVQDHLNTHTPGSFYDVASPEAAFELAQRFELHYTPIKGSWLNMAEIELSVLSRQCLDRRLSEIDSFAIEVSLWTAQRNHARKTVRWKFTKTDA
jgi:DDE superfamily endonuclease